MLGRGRPASVDAASVRALKAQGLSTTAISKALGIGASIGAGDAFEKEVAIRSYF
jgi:hypothetical protein